MIFYRGGKRAAERVLVDNHKKWMTGGGIRQWAKRRKQENVGRGGKGIGRWWEKKIGRTEEEVCPKCGEEEQTPDHIVFRCGKVRRVRDERGRREWARENGMRWDSWDALASKKWVRMEESGRVDDEGRPILEKVDLMETFFAGVHRQI